MVSLFLNRPGLCAAGLKAFPRRCAGSVCEGSLQHLLNGGRGGGPGCGSLTHPLKEDEGNGAFTPPRLFQVVTSVTCACAVLLVLLLHMHVRSIFRRGALIHVGDAWILCEALDLSAHTYGQTIRIIYMQAR